MPALASAVAVGRPFNADLHCHSTASDGLFAPAEVVAKAAANGVELLALTDHDTLDGLPEAFAAAQVHGVQMVAGVEISVSWGDDQTVHIVGLNFDPQHAGMRQGLQRVCESRDSRGREMARQLEKIGCPNVWEGVMQLAGNPKLVSRAHFARYLVDIGWMPNFPTVFQHYLRPGRPGFVPHEWTSLEEALGWIHEAGGVAVIAHPACYRVSQAEMERLYKRFKALGGEGVEVVSGSQGDLAIQKVAAIARRYGFAASRGSDFHGPGEGFELGRMVALPADLEPIWARF